MEARAGLAPTCGGGGAAPTATPTFSERNFTRAQLATPIPVDGAFHSGSTNSDHRVQVWSFEAVQDQTYVRPTAQLGQAQLA